MDRLHALSAIARGSSLVLCLAWFFPSHAATSLTGVVKDSLGHALSGAEVLVLADRLPVAPLASAQTNEEGRYNISQLAPGVYRVAALKQGYLAYLGEIDTLLKTSMDFVLRPAPATAEGATVPADAAWVLRVPERSILRDTDARDLLPVQGRGGAPSPSASSFYETLQGQVDHLMALGGMPTDAEMGSTAVAGSNTSMRLSSTVGERTSIKIQGHRESLASNDAGADDATGLDGSSMLVDVSYDTGSDSRLVAKAYYGTRDLTFETPEPDGDLSGVRQGQRSWGYDAAWSKQLDAASRMTFQAGYLETSLEGGVQPLDGIVGVSDVASTRLAGARGLFETVVGDGHHVRLGAQTEHAFASEDLGPGFAAGWHAVFGAEDTWSALGPLSLVYGVAIDHGFDTGAPLLVVPHAGYAVSAKGMSLRMVLSYQVAGDPTEAGASFDPLGYDVQLEAPLSHGTYFRGSVQRTPGIAPGIGEQATSSWTSRSLLPVLDGGAGTRRARVSVERQASNVRMTVLFSTGTAEGLSQMMPLDAPFRIETEPSLRFSSGGIGVRLLPTGTDIAAEYVRVQESASRVGDSEIAPTEEYIELRVVQDLLRLPSWGGTCRLLVAARTAPRQESDEGSSDSARTLAALDHRLSAGLSVAF